MKSLNELNKLNGTSPDRVLETYNSVLRSCCAMDFDDLLLGVQRLLLDHQDILAALRRRHRHLLVDEYQDCNPVQVGLGGACYVLHGGAGLLMVVVDVVSSYSYTVTSSKSSYTTSCLALAALLCSALCCNLL